MGGGLLQLVAYGAQDVYLTGSPQITFFKVVYRRHTNFAMESIQQTLSGNVGFGNRVTCQISRNGDLIHKIYLSPTLNVSGLSAPISVSSIGHYLLDKVEVEIGGQVIDRQYGMWMYIWNELSLPSGKKHGFDKMVGEFSSLNNGSHKLNIPLEFWFCRNVGLALPLIALQYHEVRININFAADIFGGKIAIGSTEMWVDYIFLDTDERRRFAQMSHEYLIDQVQFTGTESVTPNGNPKPRLNFNHPCKEFVWVVRDTSSGVTATNWNVFYPPSSVKLQLNGNDRFATRDGDYFYLVQPYQHHENIPMTSAGSPKYISVYSFGLKPEEHQPSGTLNMSRIDTATMNIATGSAGNELWIFATNYNVLRILSGMGGLAYSN